MMDRGTSNSNRVPGNSPWFPDIGVIGLVPDRWEGIYQPRHQVMSRLAKYFNVVWVTPASGWRESWRKNTSPPASQVETPTGRESFIVYRSGKMLPKLFKPERLATLVERLRLEQAHRLLQDRGCTKFVLYLWRPDFASALDLVHHDLVCYHIDDEYTFVVTEQPLSESERTIITSADQVFIHSPALLEKKGHLNKHTKFVPNGVDYHAYAATHPEPDDLRTIKHPRIGYIGVVKSQMDFDLLLALSRRHPAWSFVIVGPRGYLDERDKRLIETIERQTNVYFLGGKSVDALPAYTEYLDVCLMCYRVNDYTKFIYPLKLHEYLASGCPVVGAPIRSLQEFSKVLALANTEEEWSTAIEAALHPDMNTEEWKEIRRSVARKHDWSTIVTTIAGSICERLGSGYNERFVQGTLASATAIVRG